MKSRKITKQIERVALITRPARLAAGQVETPERAEDVFVKGIVDERFDGDKCIVRRERFVDAAHKGRIFRSKIPAVGSLPLDSLGESRQTRSPRRSG